MRAILEELLEHCKDSFVFFVFNCIYKLIANKINLKIYTVVICHQNMLWKGYSQRSLMYSALVFH